MPSLIPEPLTSILPHTLPHPHPQPQPHLDTMCHSTVFWYLCNHLVFNETKCPFEGTLPSHSKDFTTAAFTDHPCCLCQQPASPAVEALREGQLTPSRLQPVFGIDVNDTRFPWCVAEFFARGEHLRYKQPDPRFRRDSGAGAGAASASASRTSSFSSGSSGRGTCAPSVSKAKQSPTIKNKKSPPMPCPKQSSSPPTKNNNPTEQPTPQVKQSIIPQPMQKSMPPTMSKPVPQPMHKAMSPSMPQPTTQSMAQPIRQSTPRAVPRQPATIPISEDDFLAEALKEWEREMSAPDSDFTKVDFEAIRHFHELEELSGIWPQGCQVETESQTTQSTSSTQQGTQPHDKVQPQVQRKQEPTPYDGTNWGQEGVYLPRENYYFAGEKSSSVLNAQIPFSLSGPGGHPVRLHVEMEQSFLELTNIDECCDGRKDNNARQSPSSLNQSFSEAPVANYMQQQGHASSANNANANIKHSLPQQQNESPIAHLSPKEIHQFAAPSTKIKNKNSKSNPKTKSSPTPTVTIIDGFCNSCADVEIENPINIKRASKTTTTKDPTRGIKDSRSRVTKPSSAPSSVSTSVSSTSTTQKSARSNNKGATERATTQQQKQQPWKNTPETVPSSSSDLMNYTTSNVGANVNANGNSAMTLCF